MKLNFTKYYIKSRLNGSFLQRLTIPTSRSPHFACFLERPHFSQDLFLSASRAIALSVVLRVFHSDPLWSLPNRFILSSLTHRFLPQRPPSRLVNQYLSGFS